MLFKKFNECGLCHTMFCMFQCSLINHCISSTISNLFGIESFLLDLLCVFCVSFGLCSSPSFMLRLYITRFDDLWLCLPGAF